MIEIYTDGACQGNPGPGGWAAIAIFDPEGLSEARSKCGGFRETTNNRMELMAVLESIKLSIGQLVDVTIYSDSKYVINGITKGWAKKWRSNNWITKDKKKAANIDLWTAILDELAKTKNVKFVWVKGHAGNKWNEEADRMAVDCSLAEDLPEDTGYQPATSEELTKVLGTLLNGEQPDPVPNGLPAVWDLVVADMHERDRIGAERYKTRLQPHNGRDALKDAYDEALDLAVYLRTAIYERDGK